jgi:hypothetical protein
MQLESILQTNIVEALSMLARSHNFLYFSVPNEGTIAGSSMQGAKSNYALITMLKKMGLTPGAPDLVIIAEGGRAFCMEVKTEEGKLSTRQEVFRDRCRELGIPYVVVRSVGECVEQLRTWGIVRKK